MNGINTPEAVELARELHGLLARELVSRMKGEPSAEVLNTARAFLALNGTFGPQDERDRKVLRRIWRLYLERLLEGVLSGNANASLFAEVGHALRQAGIERASSAAAPGAVLQLARLPFNNPQ